MCGSLSSNDASRLCILVSCILISTVVGNHNMHDCAVKGWCYPTVSSETESND